MKKKYDFEVFTSELIGNRRVYSVIYQIHHFLLRFVIALSILLTGSVDSWILWGILVGLQILFTLVHIFKIYKSLLEYVVVIIRECHLTLTFFYCFMLHFVDDQSEAKIYWIYWQYVGMHLAILLVNMLIILSPFILSLSFYLYWKYEVFWRETSKKTEKKKDESGASTTETP